MTQVVVIPPESTSSRFLDVLRGTRRNEGVLSMDPKDRGNWTSGTVGVGELRGSKFGISAMTYPKLRIADLTWEEARTLYWLDFWLPAGCGSLPSPLDRLVFDCEINHPPRTGVRFMQRALGLSDDGYVGPVTTAAIKPLVESKAARLAFVGRFIVERLRYFARISTFPTHGAGWTNRAANELADAIDEVSKS